MSIKKAKTKPVEIQYVEWIDKPEAFVEIKELTGSTPSISFCKCGYKIYSVGNEIHGDKSFCSRLSQFPPFVIKYPDGEFDIVSAEYFHDEFEEIGK